jgi:membrane protease YdiL (CAAX protease family)
LEKKREKSAKFYVQMVIGLIAFAALIGIVIQKWFAQENTFIKFVPFVVFGAWTYYFVNLSRIPFKDIGLTLSNFRPAFFSMINATTVFLLLMVGLKWICITALPEYFGHHLLEIDQFNSMDKSQTIWLILFIAFQPFIEELLTRGCLQNGMFQFLIGEQTKKTGILAAALLFSLAYLFFDLKLALLSLISGLFLGSLFYKWKSIPAVYIMHILVSIAAVLLFQIIS